MLCLPSIARRASGLGTDEFPTLVRRQQVQSNLSYHALCQPQLHQAPFQHVCGAGASQHPCQRQDHLAGARSCGLRRHHGALFPSCCIDQLVSAAPWFVLPPCESINKHYYLQQMIIGRALVLACLTKITWHVVTWLPPCSRAAAAYVTCLFRFCNYSQPVILSQLFVYGSASPL